MIVDNGSIPKELSVYPFNDPIEVRLGVYALLLYKEKILLYPMGSDATKINDSREFGDRVWFKREGSLSNVNDGKADLTSKIEGLLPGNYTLLSGGVKLGEPLLVALKREALAEMGLELDDDRLSLVSEKPTTFTLQERWEGKWLVIAGIAFIYYMNDEEVEHLHSLDDTLWVLRNNLHCMYKSIIWHSPEEWLKRGEEEEWNFLRPHVRQALQAYIDSRELFQVEAGD